MAAETASPPAASVPAFSPAKVSRYRSVRIKQQQQQQQQQLQQQAAPPVPAMPSSPPMDAHRDAPVSRSMSRYHRRPTTAHGAAKAPPVRLNTEVSPALPTNGQAAISNARQRALTSPQQQARVANDVQKRPPTASKTRTDALPLVAKGAREPSQTARDEAKQVLQGEAERQRRIHEQQKAEKRAKLEAEQAERETQERLRQEEEEARLRAEQEEAEEARRLQLQREAQAAEQLRLQQEEQERGRRLQKAESAAHLRKREEEGRKAQAPPPTSPPRHGGVFGGIMSRRRKDDAPPATRSPPSKNTPRKTSNGSQQDLETIRPGGGGAVLGIDAPISAVNAGERRVQVICRTQRMFYPVTPTTSPLEIIKSAATVLTENIDTKTAILLEHYMSVGLRRPLRDYEYVRDVINSWRNDEDNELLIVDPASENIDLKELRASHIPQSKPDDMGTFIYYSSRPGKWSKRFFTLRSDGQLVMAKNENAKDQQNICHLSDFDIFSLTKYKMSKVKPPKKICYAIKSLQKASMFEDQSHFVHFFCTNDRNTASLFYQTMQSWRSWYLYHVMGEGQKPTETAQPKAPHLNGVSPSNPQAAGTTSHARGSSVGSHYQLGSFTPFQLDFDQVGKEPREVYKPGSYPDDAPLAKLDSKTMHARKMSVRHKAPPPLSYSLGTVTQEDPSASSRGNSVSQDASGSRNSGTFAPSGLLGRTYSQRQRTVQEREQKPSGPFTDGPSLLNNGIPSSANDSGLTRRSSVRSTHKRTSSDIQRSMSTRRGPAPLVDLTPQYKPPPQHANKGKAFIPEDYSGPLVENATSIEEPIKIPSSTDWQVRPATARAHGTHGTQGYERTRSLKNRGEALAAYTVNNHSGAPEDNTNAFTGGLLARTGYSQGHHPVGHGVMDGSKARGPMLDMREQSKFASGSLLANVERTQGPAGPVVERAKRQSVDMG